MRNYQVPGDRVPEGGTGISALPRNLGTSGIGTSVTLTTSQELQSDNGPRLEHDLSLYELRHRLNSPTWLCWRSVCWRHLNRREGGVLRNGLLLS